MQINSPNVSPFSKSIRYLDSIKAFRFNRLYVTEHTMNEYMLIYQGGDPEWMENTSEEEIAAAMDQWGTWMGNLQATGQLITGGSPLCPGGKSISNDKIVTDISAAEIKELIGGYSIIRAHTIEEATTLAKSCPVLNSPGVSVQVREIMQIG